MTSRLPRTFHNLKNRCFTTKTTTRDGEWLVEKMAYAYEKTMPIYLAGIPVCTLVGIAAGAYVGGCGEYRNPSTKDIFAGAISSGMIGAWVGMAVGITSPILIPVTVVGLPTYYLSSVILK